MTDKFIENGFSEKQARALVDEFERLRMDTVTKAHFDIELVKLHLSIREVHVAVGEECNDIKKETSILRENLADFKVETGAKLAKLDESVGVLQRETLSMREDMTELRSDVTSLIQEQPAIRNEMVDIKLKLGDEIAKIRKTLIVWLVGAIGAVGAVFGTIGLALLNFLFESLS